MSFLSGKMLAFFVTMLCSKIAATCYSLTLIVAVSGVQVLNKILYNYFYQVTEWWLTSNHLLSILRETVINITSFGNMKIHQRGREGGIWKSHLSPKLLPVGTEAKTKNLK